MIYTQSDRIAFIQALIATVVLFAFLLLTTNAYAQAVTLSVNVQKTLTFTTTNQGFANGATNITPGTPLMATTTVSVTTNDTSGYFVQLSGGNKTTANNNLQTAGNTYSIPDQTEWINPAATSTAGNAVQINSFVNATGIGLAFRVAASSTNGSVGTASAWWGSADNYVTNSASTLYAGIASSTNSRTIINPTSTSNSYSANPHLNDVQYYLNVGVSQATGSYTAPLTYTATGY